jgi:hypothetical protein
VVAVVIVLLDVLEIDRLLHAGQLKEVAEIAGKVRVIHDAPAVALEVAIIDDIETDQGREEPPVGFGQAVA